VLCQVCLLCAPPVPTLMSLLEPSFCPSHGCLLRTPPPSQTAKCGLLRQPPHLLQHSQPTRLSPQKTSSDLSQDGKHLAGDHIQVRSILSFLPHPQSFCFPVFLIGLGLEQMLSKHLRITCGVHRARWRFREVMSFV